MIYFYTNPTDRVWADSALKILHFQRQMFLFGFPSLKKEEGKNYSFYRTHLQKDKTEGPLSAALLFQQKQEVLYDGKVAPYGNLFQYSQRIRL